MTSPSLTGHERLAILRAINAEARPDFSNVALGTDGSAHSSWKVGSLGVLSMIIDLDDRTVDRPSFRFNDGRRVDLRELGMNDALIARLRTVWPWVIEELKIAADAEARALLEDDGDDESASLAEASDHDALIELGAHCRRIMLEIVLDPSLSPDDIGMLTNSGAGVGNCYAAALDLGLVSLRDGADPEGFTFADLIAPDVVQELIRDAEVATWKIPLPLTAHDRIRLGAELCRLQRAA